MTLIRHQCPYFYCNKMFFTFLENQDQKYISCPHCEEYISVESGKSINEILLAAIEGVKWYNVPYPSTSKIQRKMARSWSNVLADNTIERTWRRSYNDVTRAWERITDWVRNR